MATLLQERDIDCFVIDDENAVLVVNKEKYVLDYTTLMDFLTRLAVSASIMENSVDHSLDQCRARAH